MGKFIIYGAGNRGKWCLEFLEWRNLADFVLAFCDKRYGEIGQINGKKVLSYEEAKKANVPFLISNSNGSDAAQILKMIEDDGHQGFVFDEFYKVLNEEQTVFLREWCAYHHAQNNDQWFQDAEKTDQADVFWNENSVFLQYFKQLDLRNVIELACGRGRHVPYYKEAAGKITLVDILEENMVFCKNRFSNTDKIVYYKNNGFNLEKLGSSSYTSLFSYDSMVHFEMMDVYEYLKDIYRVLVDGGKALLHHSNYSADYKADFAHAPHARCFMNKEIFAYFAYRNGFKVLEQKVIGWHGVENLDCITLLEK